MVLIINTVLVKIGIKPVKNTTDNSLIIKIFAYSAMKINANIPPLYSTLNPETNSDSPSAKSKGVRFVSARFVMNQNTNISKIINMGQFSVLIDIKDISIFL